MSICIIVYLFYNYRISLTRVYVLSGLGVLAIAAITLAFDLESLSVLTIRRALYVGASVTFDWIDYFSKEPSIWWTDRHLLFGRFPTQYTGVNIPEMMAQIKVPGPPWAFNSGLVGTGYAQGGIFGVALYAALLGVLINYANRLIKRGGSVYIAAAILIGPIRGAWADSDLLTVILSHGILVALVMLSMLDRDEQPTVRRSQ